MRLAYGGTDAASDDGTASTLPLAESLTLEQKLESVMASFASLELENVRLKHALAESRRDAAALRDALQQQAAGSSGGAGAMDALSHPKKRGRPAKAAARVRPIDTTAACALGPVSRA